MNARAFVLFVGVSESTPALQVRASLEYWLKNATDEQITAGIITWPEGDGERFLLPALVPR